MLDWDGIQEQWNKDCDKHFSTLDKTNTNSNYTTTGSTFNTNTLIEAIDALIPKWDSPQLDAFMEGKESIRHVTMVTPLENMKNVPHLMTKHGKLKVQYSHHIPYDKIFFLETPDILKKYPSF
jgi:hypothetical protein